jgi:hypothetical protein
LERPLFDMYRYRYTLLNNSSFVLTVQMFCITTMKNILKANLILHFLCFKLFVVQRSEPGPHNYFHPGPELHKKDVTLLLAYYIKYGFNFFFLLGNGRTEIFFIIHSHNSCRPSGDCGGSRDRTRNCCIAV